MSDHNFGSPLPKTSEVVLDVNYKRRKMEKSLKCFLHFGMSGGLACNGSAVFHVSQ